MSRREQRFGGGSELLAAGVEERSAEAPPAGAAPAGAVPDPEELARPTRRQFTAEYRLRILEEADRCTHRGEVGRLLRREGLYSSDLANWRKARREGALSGLRPKKRGRKPNEAQPSDAEGEAAGSEGQASREGSCRRAPDPGRPGKSCRGCWDSASKTGRTADGGKVPGPAGRHRAGVPGAGRVAIDLLSSCEARSRATAAPPHACPGTEPDRAETGRGHACVAAFRRSFAGRSGGHPARRGPLPVLGAHDVPHPRSEPPREGPAAISASIRRTPSRSWSLSRPTRSGRGTSPGLLGPQTWTYYYLYVLLDLFSRYAVGWMVADRENSALAQRLIEETCLKHGVKPHVLTLHSDRGAPMTSQGTAQLLARLGVNRSLGRPRVSDDNPYSEAQFKTLKYHPDFPSRFPHQDAATDYCRSFFPWYNTEHRHAGIAMLTPETVQYGRAQTVIEQRQRTLSAAWESSPERFVGGPTDAHATAPGRLDQQARQRDCRDDSVNPEHRCVNVVDRFPPGYTRVQWLGC